MILHLRDILIGDQAHEVSLAVHHRKFLDLVVQKHLRSVGQVGAVRRDEAVPGGHHLRNRTQHVPLETQIPVRDDTDQLAIRIHNRNSADLVLLHQIQRVAHRILLRDGHRVVDHAVLGTLHPADLSRLFRNGHVLVDHTDTAFTRQRNGQRRLRHGIHRGGHNGDVELDITRETGLDADLSRQHFRIGGYEQHIVERKSFGLNPFIDKRHNERGFLLLAKVIIFFETA